MKKLKQKLKNIMLWKLILKKYVTYCMFKQSGLYSKCYKCFKNFSKKHKYHCNTFTFKISTYKYMKKIKLIIHWWKIKTRNRKENSYVLLTFFMF